MIVDAVEYAKRCKACQIHADFIYQPLELLHPTVTSWPFKAWGIDILGPISPPSAKYHRFILTITDYFSKWAEAIPLVEVKTTTWSTLSDIMSSTDLVSLDGSSMTMVSNSQANRSISFATNT